MKNLICIIALLNSFAAQAKPPSHVVEACLKTQNIALQAIYTEFSAETWSISQDEDQDRTERTMKADKKAVGTWLSNDNHSFGLVYGEDYIPISQVRSLTKGESPVRFDPYLALWGTVRENGKSYVCITFNFDGLGRNGAYQNIRGAYLIDERAPSTETYYAVANIASAQSYRSN